MEDEHFNRKMMNFGASTSMRKQTTRYIRKDRRNASTAVIDQKLFAQLRIFEDMETNDVDIKVDKGPKELSPFVNEPSPSQEKIRRESRLAEWESGRARKEFTKEHLLKRETTFRKIIDPPPYTFKRSENRSPNTDLRLNLEFDRLKLTKDLNNVKYYEKSDQYQHRC